MKEYKVVILCESNAQFIKEFDTEIECNTLVAEVEKRRYEYNTSFINGTQKSKEPACFIEILDDNFNTLIDINKIISITRNRLPMSKLKKSLSLLYGKIGEEDSEEEYGEKVGKPN